MVVIDLLPPDEARAARMARRWRVAGRSAAAVLVAGVSLAHAGLEVATAATRQEAAAVDAELRVLRRPAAALRRLRARQARLARRLSVIEALAARGRRTLAPLDAVAVALPDGAWLTELTLDDGRLRVAGVARDDRLIVEFVARLRATGAVPAVDLEEAGGVEGEAAGAARRFVVGGSVGGGA